MKKLQATGLIAGLLVSATLFAADAPKTPLPMNAGKGFSQEGLKRIDAFFADEIAFNRKIDQVSILEEFHKESLRARIESKLSEAIFDLRVAFKSKKGILLTNCDVSQIVEVVNTLGLDVVFGEDLIGTPPTKHTQARNIRESYPNSTILSISDSESDGEIARENSFDFLFVEEFSRGDKNWTLEGYFKVSNLKELL